MSEVSFHSVTLDTHKCKGCTTCIRHCPTEAIRVRKGRASIIDERCVDCGQCIRVCPHGAKKAISDPLSALEKYNIRVALPAPTLYGQFDEKFTINRILNGLTELGFTDIVEVAWAAESLSKATRLWLQEHNDGIPYISSACPAIVKLLQVRFPSLLDRLVPFLSPMEIAGRIVKEHLYPGRKDVGVFFISPCAGKVTVSRYPQGINNSSIDGVIAIKDIYIPLRAVMPGEKNKYLQDSGSKGIAWAHIDGESEAVGLAHSISVSGISDVISVLEAMENGSMKGVDFIEALACPAGCVGGPLTVENPYIARARIKALEATLPEIQEKVEAADKSGLKFEIDESIKARSSLSLAPDILKAMIMLEETETITSSLPGLDCGSCGAPSCKAFAEDIAKGNAVITDCIFKLRENVRKLAEELINIESIQPPGLDKN